MKLFLIPFIVVLIILLISLGGFWFKVENSVRDYFFQLRGSRPLLDDIVIVEIGDQTFTGLGERWPLSSWHFLRFIENMKAAEVRQLVFCFDLPGEAFFPFDSLAAQGARIFDNIVWSGHDFSGQLLSTEVEKENVIFNRGNPELQEDRDGVVRRYRFFTGNKKDIVYSTGMVALGSLHGNPEWRSEILDSRNYLGLRDKLIPKIDLQRCLLNFYGPERSFKYYDLVDVLDDENFRVSSLLDIDKFTYLRENEHFKDKIVLLGLTSEEFQDNYLTPFSASQDETMPGVEIQANFIQMVLNDEYLNRFSLPLVYLLILVFSLLVFWLDLKLKIVHSLLLNIFIIICYFVIVYMAFANNNLILPILFLPMVLIIQFLISAIVLGIRKSQLREFIRNSFQEKISPGLLNEMILRYELKNYAPQECELTLLTVRLPDFTGYLKTHALKESLEIQKGFLSTMSRIIINNNGYLDRSYVDSINAVFGAPVAVPEAAYLACKAAMEMLQGLEQLKSGWMLKKYDVPAIAACVTTGTAIIGDLGSDIIFSYTAYGDCVYNCQQLFDNFAEFKSSKNILIDEATYNLAGGKIKAFYLDDIQFKSRPDPIKIYELIEVENNSQINPPIQNKQS